MNRLFFFLLGVLVALLPARILTSFESLAMTDDEPPVRNDWVTPGLRVEGIVIALVSLFGGRLYAGLVGVTGVAGVILLLTPRRYLAFATRLAYEEPESIQWHDRIEDALRVLGVGYGLIALRTRQRHAGTDR